MIRVAVFDTLKKGGKGRLSSEAKRQREMIAYLAIEQGPEFRTRIAIAHALASKFNTRWQNIYSSIFRDLDEILIPADIVREKGRLPPRRGPRALQHEGVPYYELTQRGMLIASCLNEVGEYNASILRQCIYAMEEDSLRDGMLLLLEVAPSLTLRLIREYVMHYSLDIESMVPVSADKLRYVLADSIRAELEFVETFMSLSKDRRSALLNFMHVLSQ
ncbi:MAG: hypothetical protein RMJ59_00440 [Candidatus Nitrosocaldus sp.]|nr:hypothetical protein [Candidatus Nitrosocaldus sp.]MDW8274831.1 hypothetical protein [Candidatus Nitrosocaldus sp.]